MSDQGEHKLGRTVRAALLTSLAVATPGSEGRLGGLGTGLGYFGTILVLATVFVLINLVVDLVQSVVDPRIKRI